MTHLSIKEGLQKEICLVEVDPEKYWSYHIAQRAYRVKVDENNEWTDRKYTVVEAYTKDQGHTWNSDELPNGAWQLIGLCSEVSEEVVRGITDSVYYSNEIRYIHNGKFFDSALESFQSLLKHHSISPERTILLIKK